MHPYLYSMPGMKEIFALLEFDQNNGLHFTSDNSWKNETSFPNRVQRLIDRKISPDAFFSFDNKPFILFYENPKNREELYKAIWNFNESPIVIIIENGSIEIFNGFKYLLEKKSLEKIGEEGELLNFNYFKLVTGKAWEEYQDSLDYKNRVDYRLLDNIKVARKVLVDKFNLNSTIANALIGKVIFVRYLIDRKVKMKYDNKLRTWSNSEFCKLLLDPSEAKAFFEYLEDKDRGFNGDLFPLAGIEYENIDNGCFEVLNRLLSGENIETNQKSLFELFDFSIIPIEFISNVYELFIGQENQKNEGAYYTPLFLVDYILKETVEQHLNLNFGQNSPEIKFPICKVLDPACGSGIFLVETLRKIIEKHIVNSQIDTKSKAFKTCITNIAKQNIFGVDKDPSAIQVAIFSIYLTLLDYLDPPGIETFQFPLLSNTNFFVSDFFNQESLFNDTLKDINFDFILGNPPWMRGKGEVEDPLYVKYIKNRKKIERGHDGPIIDIGNKELAQAFVLRASDFCSTKTCCALIVTSKILYNNQSKDFRTYFLHHFHLERVFELAPVRKEVFDKSNDKAIAPACILFFKSAFGQNTDHNSIEHIALKPSRFFKLFKVFTLSRNDFKRVEQSTLKSYDWLWKILVYGSYLDFNFIRRLKEDFLSIGEEINSRKDFIIGQGIMIGGGDQNDASELVGLPFIDTRLDIKQFWINQNSSRTWTQPIVHRVRNNQLFKSPMLLITAGVRNDLRSVSAVSRHDAVYKSSLTGVKGFGDDGVLKLRQIAGIINSSFFSYINLMTFSSSGIEREESHDTEKWNVPYVENSQVSILVEELEGLCQLENTPLEKFRNPELESKIESKTKELDQAVDSSFTVGVEEDHLLRYANEIVIPIIMKHKGHEQLFNPIKVDHPVLENYADVFINQFQNALNTSEEKFVVEIFYSSNIVGMFFKRVSRSENLPNVYSIDHTSSDSDLMAKIAELSSLKITERLFVQKDIRGFEKDFFYIFKPNEMRLWHPAIALLDRNEFSNAILKAGRAGY